MMPLKEGVDMRFSGQKVIGDKSQIMSQKKNVKGNFTRLI